VAFALALLGAFVLVEATQLRMTTLGGGPGPGVFPIALGTLLLVLGVSLAPATVRERTTFGHVPRLAGLAGVLLVYAILLDRLGFVITTSLAMAGMLAAFTTRRRALWAAIGVVGAIASYALFSSILHVQLPPDPWFFWP
jgi:putative tricarboxylic transport membrane protein